MNTSTLNQDDLGLFVKAEFLIKDYLTSALSSSGFQTKPRIPDTVQQNQAGSEGIPITDRKVNISAVTSLCWLSYKSPCPMQNYSFLLRYTSCTKEHIISQWKGKLVLYLQLFYQPKTYSKVTKPWWKETVSHIDIVRLFHKKTPKQTDFAIITHM